MNADFVRVMYLACLYDDLGFVSREKRLLMINTGLAYLIGDEPHLVYQKEELGRYLNSASAMYQLFARFDLGGATEYESVPGQECTKHSRQSENTASAAVLVNR